MLSFKKSTHNGHINECCISPTAPSITHLLFIDDSLLFFKATTEEANSIKQVLHSYELLSAQAVNFQKSDVFFSATEEEIRKRRL